MSDTQAADTTTQATTTIQGPATPQAEVSLLDQIANVTKDVVRKDDKDQARLVDKGIKELLRHLLTDPELKAEDKSVSRAAVDRAILAIDKKIGQQVDLILHSQKFKEIESAWRGLKYLVDNTDFRENIKINVLNVTKKELLTEFEKRPEIMRTGLYKHVYTAEYGQFGGKPYGAIIGNYYVDAGAEDVKFLQKMAAVATMAHAPFITSIKPQFFGLETMQDFPDMKDIKGVLEGTAYAAWRGFRDSEDSRYVGLTAPRFLLRMPYGKDNSIGASRFTYEEQVTKDHESYMWGNAAFAFATRLTESFARYRWCANIIGPRGGGEVRNLPVHLYKSPKGDLVAKIPTEVLVSERREYEMSEEGFITLTMRKDENNASFFSANSAQRPKTFGISKEGKDAETNFRLGTQLPYMFVISRLAHYIKVLQREEIGTAKERADLERDLNVWISQYVTEDDNPMPGIRATHPIRMAKIAVEDVPGQPGWYKVDMKIRPHFKYMGASFTLSLVGKLDKK